MISFIKDFHIIEQEQVEISEQAYKEKYSNLLTKWNELIPEYNELLKNHESLMGQYDDSLSEIKILKDKLTQKHTLTEMIKILFLGASQ